MPTFDVFISYRRNGGSELARLIKSALTSKGVNAFLDVVNLKTPGFFDSHLRSIIEQTPNFLVILQSGAFDQNNDEIDWFVSEISHAIEYGRNIIPVMKRDFHFPKIEEMPEQIVSLRQCNGVIHDHLYFDSMIDNLVNKYLIPDCIDSYQPYLNSETATAGVVSPNRDILNNSSNCGCVGSASTELAGYKYCLRCGLGTQLNFETSENESSQLSTKYCDVCISTRTVSLGVALYCLDCGAQIT